MSDGKPKLRLITFKVDEELFEELERLPNKSAQIRIALQKHLRKRCPVCEGTGVLDKSKFDRVRKRLSTGGAT